MLWAWIVFLSFKKWQKCIVHLTTMPVFQRRMHFFPPVLSTTAALMSMHGYWRVVPAHKVVFSCTVKVILPESVIDLLVVIQNSLNKSLTNSHWSCIINQSFTGRAWDRGKWRCYTLIPGGELLTSILWWSITLAGLCWQCLQVIWLMRQPWKISPLDDIVPVNH